MSLPVPDPASLARSHKLTARIRDEIDRAGGWIAFSRYMELALYTPGLGYYAVGERIFGVDGDFTTAPELTPLYGHTLARAFAPVLAATAGSVLELGAGRGTLAADVLTELARIDCLPRDYCILEVSAALAAQQRATLAARVPDLLDRVRWLTQLPADFYGVIVANEVLDAVPVEVLRQGDDGPLQRGVVHTANGFAWADRVFADPTLHAQAAALKLAPGYVSEFSPLAAGLIVSVLASLGRGAAFFIDYGFPAREYYHPQRHMGTLRAHARQHALDDPFYLPGGVDLTAHVDFSAARDAGITDVSVTAYYATQARFLVEAGLLELLAGCDPENPAAYLPQANAVARLLSPAEMGELFKVLVFGKNLDARIPGCTDAAAQRAAML